MRIELPEVRGVCRWCGCTDTKACDGGCSWINPEHTVCSACTFLDQAMHSNQGRATVARLVHEHIEDLDP